METKTSLVRSDGRVELNSVTCVSLNFTIVINPSNLECKDTLRLYDTLNDLCCLELRVLVVNFLIDSNTSCTAWRYSFSYGYLAWSLAINSLVFMLCVINWLFNFPSRTAAEQIINALDL